MKIVSKSLAVAAAFGVMSAVGAAQAQNRDHIHIVGSSTVFPFATAVAETFGRTSGFKTPVIESTGSGGGLKLFCAGTGLEHPDITNASRRIKSSEVEKCAKNGIADITEIKIGYDGIVLSNSKKSAQMSLTRQQIFLALAAQVPGPDGKLIPNPNKKWSDIDSSLPNVEIEVLGPPPTSGTRDAFAELALEGGAKKFADLKTLRGLKDEAEILAMTRKLGLSDDVWNGIKESKAKKGKKAKGKDVFKGIAHGVREDGAWIEAGENDNLIVNKLDANPDAFGVFGFSFLDQNSDKLQGSIIEGTAPEFEAIGDGSYPVSRSLFFYVKKAHVGTVPGIKEYLAEFTSDNAWGDDGYLAEKGLIPMPAAERAQFKAAAEGLTNLSM